MTDRAGLRKHFGEYLEKLGAKHKNLVVLDSDLSNGLNTLLFAKNHPERHFSVPEAERAMLSMATGMTIRKKNPWVCARAGNLLGRALDILRNGVVSPNLNLKIILSDVGLGNLEHGACRTSTEDLAILRSLPNLKIFTPADQHELRAMMEFMTTDFGPTVMRIPAQCHEDIFDGNYIFNPGTPVIVRRGEQICLFSHGNMLQQTLQAASELMSKGLSAQVVNLPTPAPLDEEKLAEICTGFDLLLSVEDHSLQGGLGTILAELLQKKSLPARLVKLGLTAPVESGKYQEVLEKHGIGTKNIYETVREKWLQS